MPDPEAIRDAILDRLDAAGGAYRLFAHRPIVSDAGAAAVRLERGFVGTEGKCPVLKVGDRFAVCTTLEGRRAGDPRGAARLGGGKARLATAALLRDCFGAVPGCAYPFACDPAVAVVVDPAVFAEPRLLFSPALPTQTGEVRGADLAGVFAALPNRTETVDAFAPAVPVLATTEAAR